MKNREEYLASIFTKRDALLAKRKKHIKAAAALVCIAFTFVAAALVAPSLQKADSSPLPEDAVPSTNQAAPEKNTNIISHDATYFNMFNDYTVSPKIEDEVNDDAEANQLNFGFGGSYYSPNETKKAQAAATSLFDTGTGESYNEAATMESDGVTDDSTVEKTTKKPSAAGKYSEKEIIAAAYEYLTDEEKAVCDIDDAMSTVTRTNTGDEYYTVYFNSENKTVKIKLDAATLGIIETQPVTADTEATTAKPPVTAALPPMTTPAYNPFNENPVE